MRTQDPAQPASPGGPGQPAPLRGPVHRTALRADARDNRRRILEAARDVFTERGPGAPLDEIARRAGIGIATLYRRFPDRRGLMLEVVRDAIEQTVEEARLAISGEPDPFLALARYMHRVIDARTAAVIPALLGAVPLDDEQLRQARETGPGAVQALVDAAQQAGALRPDVTAADIGLLIVRLSRPLPGGLAPGIDSGLSHRHLDLVLDGLRATARQPAQLSGPALTMSELRRLPQPAADRAGQPGEAH
jgi:AcrR family transcriptional regulator